jgi:hypothetical protein
MPDEPISIKGGSLKIESAKRLTENNGTDGKYKYDHPDEGRITGVEIDGVSHTANQNSVIVIHYEIP